MAMPTSGGGEGGRIVDPVAGHCDLAAFAAQALHGRMFALGRDFGLDVGDPELGGDCLCRRAVVTGQHNDADALGAQSGERRGLVCLIGSATAISGCIGQVQIVPGAGGRMGARPPASARGNQIEAVKAPLKKVQDEILRDHIGHCVEHAISSGDAKDQRKKVAELVQVLSHITS